MRKKEIIWIGVLLVLGGVYVHFFSHWFDRKGMTISASLRPNRHTKPPTPIVTFTLNGEFKLTSLKVIAMDGDKINPATAPVWNLDSDSNSVPTRVFRYGQPIRGMKPALKGVHPDPLNPGVVYRLIVSTKEVTGSKDFKMPSFGD